MTWISFAILGYFCNAVSQLLDKVILTEKHIPKPAVYAFYVSLFSLFSLFFAPFGFSLIPAFFLILFLFSGVFFIVGLLAFYYAVKAGNIARIAPLVGLVTSLTVLLAGGLFPSLFGEVVFSGQVFLALGMLIIGGVLISYDLPLRKTDRLPLTAIIAGFLLGLSLLFLKYGYTEIDFINGLVWSRLGMVLAGLSLLLIPIYRKQILVHHEPAKMKSSQNIGTLALFVVNKSCAGVASFLILYATNLGSVSFVQALNGTQYVFLLILAIPLSLRFPHIFGEHLSFWDWAQKGFALVLIGLGFWFMGLSGVRIL
jgi:drug/metabolite transporter (DMT)-like permease